MKQELEELRAANATATPGARHRIIKQRLARAQDESGATRLVTTVAAVEALARSLVVHSSGRPASTAEMRYRQFRDTGPIELVEEVLRLRGAGSGADQFPGETWTLFELAHQYRDLVVHECTQPDAEAFAALIAAAEAVFETLVELSGLPRLVSRETAEKPIQSCPS